MKISFDMRKLHQGCGESLWGRPLGVIALPGAQRTQATACKRGVAPRPAETGSGTNHLSLARDAE